MKNFSFLVVVTALALGVVACGNKDSSSASSQSFSSDPYKASTVNGYLDTTQPIAIVGSVTYQISQNSYEIMRQAFQQAQQQTPQIVPVMVNGTYKYKARITGSLATQGTYQSGYNQQYPQQGTGNTLNVTQAVIYR